MPTYAQVTNLDNGRSIVVRINDRGPYAHDRVIDLSKRSARELGIYRRGTGRVRVRYLGKAPLNGDDSYERQVLASQPWRRVASKQAPKIYVRAVDDTIRETALTTASVKKRDPMLVAGAPAPSRKPAAHEKAKAVKQRTGALPRHQKAARRGRMVFVQAGAFRSELNADDVRRKLQGLGTVHVYPAEVNGTMWYRVRLGPFHEEAQARETLQKVVENGAAGARIVRH
jgi:rare lipoprotein A